MKDMKIVEAVVFDLDGTLIQSKIDYEKMRRRAVDILAEAGAPTGEFVHSRRVWEIIMGGETMLKEMGLSTERRRETVRQINEALNAIELEAVDEVKPTPYAHEALEELRGRGLRIGVATRSCNAYAIRSLELTELVRFIEVLLARDDVDHPKPDPRHLLQVVEAMGASLSTVVFVGDTTTDMKTAEEAGISFIGFLRDDEWGRRLREAGCEILIEDLRKLVDLI